jgi:hypothetical protein
MKKEMNPYTLFSFFIDMKLVFISLKDKQSMDSATEGLVQQRASTIFACFNANKCILSFLCKQKRAPADGPLADTLKDNTTTEKEL